MQFDKEETLGRVYKALEAYTSFLRPALPFVNSHLTDFFVNAYWERMLPECIRNDLEGMSVADVKSGLEDFVNGNWRKYSALSTGSLSENLTFESAKTFQELIIVTARLQLSELGLSTPRAQLCFNGVAIYGESTASGENVLKLDKIMSEKKTHEVEVMSEFIKRISETALHSENAGDKGKCIEYLVDLGSGKGYLSSYLTLLHKFKLLAVDSSSVNSHGCEKRSARLEKTWAQLVRRAVERQVTGKCSKRGKHWKSQTQTTPSPTNTTELGHDAHDNEKLNPSAPASGGREEDKVGESQISENCVESGKSATNLKIHTRPCPVKQTTSNNSIAEDTDNKLLKTLTQFVTPSFDLTSLIKDNFPTFTTTSVNKFGLVGLHTCGNLGVASLQLFISNENAKFICNVPCCFHLLDEESLFYPHKNIRPVESTSGQQEQDTSKSGSNNDEIESILKPSFPISQKLDVDDSSRFCLGNNSRVMSAYSLSKMVSIENGLQLHESIFYRALLELLIKKSLGEEYETRMNACEQKVGKMGNSCKNFLEYVRTGLKNLELDSQIQLTDAEIDDIYQAYVHQGKDKLWKYYLLRSLFSSLVEGIILLDRLTFLLEQDKVSEAYIVELFNASVSPRCHAILALKKA